MKNLVLTLTLLFSFQALALPSHITCEKDGRLIRKLTRVEFTLINDLDYRLEVLKEKSCGRGTGCHMLVTILTKEIKLFQSPENERVLVIPGFIDSNDDIEINLDRNTCKVKLTNEGFKFRGTLAHLAEEEL